jgi:uncharacterized protein YjiS (DUF1127 family)
MRFWLSCSAAIALFMLCQMPMLHLVDSPSKPELTRKRTIMFTALVRFIQQWKRYNQSLSELSRLGDRELADIGISRSDIPRLAWNSAHQI